MESLGVGKVKKHLTQYNKDARGTFIIKGIAKMKKAEALKTMKKLFVKEDYYYIPKIEGDMSLEYNKEDYKKLSKKPEPKKERPIIKMTSFQKPKKVIKKKKEEPKEDKFDKIKRELKESRENKKKDRLANDYIKITTELIKRYDDHLTNKKNYPKEQEKKERLRFLDYKNKNNILGSFRKNYKLSEKQQENLNNRLRKIKNIVVDARPPFQASLKRNLQDLDDLYTDYIMGYEPNETKKKEEPKKSEPKKDIKTIKDLVDNLKDADIEDLKLDQSPARYEAMIERIKKPRGKYQVFHILATLRTLNNEFNKGIFTKYKPAEIDKYFTRLVRQVDSKRETFFPKDNEELEGKGFPKRTLNILSKKLPVAIRNGKVYNTVAELNKARF